MKIKSFIKNKSKNILKSDITKGILTISSGAISAQAISFLFSPIITRIYPPEQYGVMSVFASVIAIISFSSLKYEMAIPIVRDDKKAINLFSLCIYISLLFTIVLFLLLVFFGNNILSLLNAETLINYKYLIPIGVLFFGLRELMWQWLFRYKNYTRITSTKVSQNIVGNIVKIGAGLLGFGVPGLLIGQVFKESFSVIPLSINMFKKEKKLIKEINMTDTRRVAKRYKNYPMYQTPTSFLAILKNQLPVFSLGFYGPSVIGLYGLANTVVKIPMTLLGHSVRNVFYAEAASIGKENPNRLKELSNKLFKKMSIIGLFPLFALILLGPFLFTLVFGAEWAESGVYSRFLAVSVYGDFIFSPVSRVFEVLERQKEKMFIDIIGLIIVLLSFVLARAINDNPTLAIMMYSLSMFCYYIVIYYFSRRFIDNEIRKRSVL